MDRFRYQPTFQRQHRVCGALVPDENLAPDVVQDGDVPSAVPRFTNTDLRLVHGLFDQFLYQTLLVHLLPKSQRIILSAGVLNADVVEIDPQRTQRGPTPTRKIRRKRIDPCHPTIKIRPQFYLPTRAIVDEIVTVPPESGRQSGVLIQHGYESTQTHDRDSPIQPYYVGRAETKKGPRRSPFCEK